VAAEFRRVWVFDSVDELEGVFDVVVQMGLDVAVSARLAVAGEGSVRSFV
jgi:hypothetical protein